MRDNRRTISRAVLVAMAVFASACAREGRPARAEAPASSPVPVWGAGAGPGAAARQVSAVPAAVEAAPQGTAVTGTVLETMDSGGYTYLRLKTAEGEVWAAVSQSVVKKGATVTVADAMPMQGFESRTLKRTFDRIYFGRLAEGGSSAAGASTEVAAAHAGAAKPVDVGPIHVDKAPAPEGRTVAEVYAERVALKDRAVAVRGKVVKFLPGIMGKNWVHVRDGSGSSEKKTDDLTVTTMDAATVGDVVLVRGTVRPDKDFGSGYTYSVMVEDAKLTKE